MDKTFQESAQNLLKQLQKYDLKNYGYDFLRTWDKDEDSILATLDVIKLVKTLYSNNISPKVFDSGIAISIFKDNSTRTRYSYASSTNLLGLLNQELDMGKSQVAHGETVKETANMISFLTRTIGIRDDIYLGVGHNYMKQVAKSVEEGYKEGSLNQRPSVINLQCDEDHPTQSMSDLSFLIEHFNGLQNLKSKKIVMSWAYSPSYGKPLSVPQGVIALMTRFGMDVTLAYPEGYNLIPEIEQTAAKNAEASGGKFEIVGDMKEAMKDADIVYPKSWAPYSVMQERTKLLKENNSKGLQKLEKRALENNRKYIDWEYNQEMKDVTKDKNALYMHCLPADITDVSCEHGEVSAEVFKVSRKGTYLEAGFKPFVIAAMILLGQYGKDTHKVLGQILKENRPIKK
ncbi:knotted carbamoyltransferase YgeW [Candidatus Dojkabacteria bacterium]|nr:knotted carbamoyltransferase YgeW [Candidatus Dojkabacteria bacterium]